MRERQNFVQKNWRSAMAVQYLVVCLFDFMFAPMFMFWWAHFTSTAYMPWAPLTLQGGSMYHIAMGAVVGITSWSKSKEQIASPIEDQP